MSRHEPTISTQIVRHVRDCLELAGVASAPLLARHGIDPGSVDDRDQSVSLADYVRFFESAAIASGNPHFGMHAARVMSADGLGPLSFLFLSAPSLGAAFQTFTEYLDAMQEATFNAFVIAGDLSHFTYSIRSDQITQRRQDAEYSIGVMCNLVRQYTARRTAPAEVHFEHERVGALSWYESYFECPVFFEQPHNRLYVPTDHLVRSSSVLSAELFPIIAAHLKQRMHEEATGRSMLDRVRDILLASPPHALPDLVAVALRLGVSRATLIRQLRHSGTNFGALAAERRLGHACQLLESSRRPVADVALACGYAEAASLTRAFSRRFGQGPSAWRRQRKRIPAT